MTEFLELEDAVHVVRRLGFHIRDVGLLASAIARPTTRLFGEDSYPTTALKAAALLDSVIRNHALVDGNKRAAWTLMVAFVWINGFRHDFTPDSAFDLVLGVARGDIEIVAAATIIEAHLDAR